MNTLDYVRNWTNQDGSIFTTFYIKNAMKKKGEINPHTGKIMDHDESEEEFINRVDSKIVSSDAKFHGLSSTLDHVSSLPDFSKREQFRRDSNGNIFIDSSIKTQAEIEQEKQNKKDKIKQRILLKLNSLGLTDEEVQLLIK